VAQLQGLRDLGRSSGARVVRVEGRLGRTDGRAGTLHPIDSCTLLCCSTHCATGIHPRRARWQPYVHQTHLRGPSAICLHCSGTLRSMPLACADGGAVLKSRVPIGCQKGHLAAARQAVARLLRGMPVRASGSLLRIRCGACSRVFFAIITEHFRPPKIHSRAGEADFGLCRD
jgi:hypothetical protein